MVARVYTFTQHSLMSPPIGGAMRFPVDVLMLNVSTAVMFSWESTQAAKNATCLTSLWRPTLKDGWQLASLKHPTWYDKLISLSLVHPLKLLLIFQLTADVLGCNVYSDGSAAAIDTWNPSETKTNVLDKDQVNSVMSQ